MFFLVIDTVFRQLFVRIFVYSLRQLQRRRGCSHILLQDVLDTMRPYLCCLGPRVYTQKDKEVQKEAGVICLELHGCVRANCDFVFPPEDDTILQCPRCQHPRYIDVAKKKAHEMVYYFPITARLKALMQTQKFKHSVNYELRCGSNPDFMTDIQDAPAWKQEMGPLPRRGHLFIDYLLCDTSY